MIDRFDTLLKTGRVIVSALSKEAICQKVEHAAVRLLRAEHAKVRWFDDGAANEASTLEQSRPGRAQRLNETSPVGEPQSELRAAIHVRGKAVAALV